jgi:mono/diheme cytochrome c family protein
VMRLVSLALIGLILLLAACGREQSTSPARVVAGPSTYGRELFEERVIGPNPGCVTCHSLEPDVTLVGPSLAGVGSRVAGMSDADYIRQSIVDPDAYVVPGYEAGLMLQDWQDYLSPDQIESLIDFLLEDQ